MQVLSQIVEICVFRRVKSSPQYLVMKRGLDDELYPNLWQIVTGTVTPSEDAVKTAIRELKEETGLTPKKFWTVPYVDSYFDLTKDAVQLAAVFAAEVDQEAEIRLSSEHQNYLWQKYRKAKETLVWTGQKNVLDIVHNFIVRNKIVPNLLEIKNSQF